MLPPVPPRPPRLIPAAWRLMAPGGRQVKATFCTVLSRVLVPEMLIENTLLTIRIGELIVACCHCSPKDSPVNRTSATMSTGISEPMSGW